MSEDKQNIYGNPQIEDGFIRIANELWNAWMCSRFSEGEERIIKVILRFSYGVGKKYAVLSKSEISYFSNIQLPNVNKVLRALETKQVIKTEQADTRGFLIIWFNKHYLDWNVKQTPIDEDFYQRLQQTLSRNLSERGDQLNGKITQLNAKITSLNPKITKLNGKITSTSCKDNLELNAKISSTSCKDNLKGAEPLEITTKSPSVNKVKEIYKDNINKYTTYDVHDPHLPGRETFQAGGPPSPLACVFFDTVSRYPEFDVREDDLIWFKRRVEGNERFKNLDLEEELHNWADWLEIQHRKKEKRKSNKFPKSNFKSSLLNWLKKALEIKKNHQTKGGHYEDNIPSWRRKKGRKGFDLPSDYPIDVGGPEDDFDED